MYEFIKDDTNKDTDQLMILKGFTLSIFSFRVFQGDCDMFILYML